MPKVDSSNVLATKTLLTLSAIIGAMLCVKIEAYRYWHVLKHYISYSLGSWSKNLGVYIGTYYITDLCNNLVVSQI